MSDPRDPFEEHLAEQLGELADTAIPASRLTEDVAATAMATGSPPRWRLAALVAAVLVAAVATTVALDVALPGVGADRSSAPSAAEPSAPTDPAGWTYSCGGPPFSPEIVNGPELELEANPAGAALADFIASGGRASGILPTDGWHLLRSDESSADFVASVPGDPPYAAAAVELRDGAWRMDRWGRCSPQLALEGVNPAIWRLAGGQDIGPDTTSFLADVTETSCASGASSEDRVLPPLVMYEPDRVVVAFIVEPLPGGGSFCIGNPSTRVSVELSEALGGRELLDGGALPWRDARSPR